MIEGYIIMRNKLFVTVAFSFITLSIQPAGRWKLFFEQYKPHFTTFNRIRVTKQKELMDEDEKNKKNKLALSRQKAMPQFQQSEKPKIISQEEGGTWRERLSKWWNSWFYTQK